MVNILVFGDSITYGVWDLEGGWVARLRKFFDEQALITDLRTLWYKVSGFEVEKIQEFLIPQPVFAS